MEGRLKTVTILNFEMRTLTIMRRSETLASYNEAKLQIREISLEIKECRIRIYVPLQLFGTAIKFQFP